MPRTTLLVTTLLGTALPASAAIIPSWRVNTITPEQIAASGGLLTSASISLSLMIELTGGSQFNVAGLDLDGALGSPDTIRYYQRASGSQFELPDDDDIANSPAQILIHDTHLATPVRGEPAATPGRLNGTGTARIGNVGLLPTTGSNRSGTNFNVAWGATPNNGGPGVFQIARITFASGVLPGLTQLGNAMSPTAYGLVTDSLNPTTSVPLPPIPVAAIPEPLNFAIAGLGLLALRRK